jgi:hypothetical protein
MLANQNFQVLKDSIPTDEQGNLTLGETAKSTRYRVLINDVGQILLDPIELPRQEQWLHQNPEALAMVQKGVQQAGAGDLHNLGSFAQYADLEIDE